MNMIQKSRNMKSGSLEVTIVRIAENQVLDKNEEIVN